MLKNNVIYRLLTFSLITLLLCTCEAESAHAPEKYNAGGMVENASMDRQEAPINEETELTLPQRADVTSSPKIIYNASVRGRVTQLDSALARVTRRVTASGGYLSSQHRTNSNWEHAATLTIRLPANQLTTTLGFLNEIAEEIDYQNLDSKDVTAEWLDLESRLQTKRDVRDRYIAILRNQAKKVEDILNAEDKIRVITEEIEAKEGRLRYLRDQVSLSTLTLELYETREYRDVGPVTKRSFGSELIAALANGWELVRMLVLGLISIWPLLLLGTGIVWGVRRWRKRKS